MRPVGGTRAKAAALRAILRASSRVARMGGSVGFAFLCVFQRQKGQTMMREIRIHGRGGQGNVTASELLAVAAFEDGKEAQAFPAFGSERMGSPVVAFTRYSDQKIRTRTQIEHPDYVIVQDPTLIGAVDVLSGLKDDGLVIVNTEKTPQELGLKTKARVMTLPAFRSRAR